VAGFADIIMNNLEIQCMKKFDFRLRNYDKFVDDIFLIISRTKIDTVLKVFNEYHSKLKFTHDIEINNFLSFFNTLVIRGKDGKILTKWYRKPIYSGRCINFFSSHVQQYNY